MAAIQISLTVEESKLLLAHALKQDDRLQKVWQSGRLCLLGGSTVSALAEILGFAPLRLCGRVDPSGCRTALQDAQAYDNILIENGQARDLAETEEDIVSLVDRLTEKDLVVISGNAFDAMGRAVIAYGFPGGGPRGKAIAKIAAKEIPTILLFGLEKFVPSLEESLSVAADFQETDFAMGMAISLAPLKGDLFTELDAFSSLFNLQAYVLTSGGIAGAQGAKTFLLKGNRQQVQSAWQFIQEKIKGAKLSAHKDSIPACMPGCGHCKNHYHCSYLSRGAFPGK